jgi:hypothetical protein
VENYDEVVVRKLIKDLSDYLASIQQKESQVSVPDTRLATPRAVTTVTDALYISALQRPRNDKDFSSFRVGFGNPERKGSEPNRLSGTERGTKPAAPPQRRAG